ncbi:MAG: DUF2461 domain-containing protein, partial [Saprospiraceae bacterium]|nr:DUF2461 domain-containing protein [Saprospiraceae bacterium]
LRGGYYYHIGSDFALIAGGFFAPNAEDLRRLRKDIVLNYSEWKSMLAEKDLSEIFGSMQGHQLETAPRGFVRDHPAIDLLRYKQFYFEKRFTADEVMNESFLADVNMAFKALRPYFDFMSYVLTTDANGVSLVD